MIFPHKNQKLSDLNSEYNKKESHYNGREQSIAGLRKEFEKAGQTLKLTDDQIKQVFPTVKATEAECKKILTIEGVAVSRDHRGKGYGTQKLYERLGFVPVESQPLILKLVGANQLRKSLKDQA